MPTSKIETAAMIATFSAFGVFLYATGTLSLLKAIAIFTVVILSGHFF